MHRFHSCPATSASMQMTGLMAVVASGAMRMSDAAQAAGRQAREDSIFQEYADALQSAKMHAAEMEVVATHAVRRVTDLEVECARLRAACVQRQEVIEALVAGRA